MKQGPLTKQEYELVKQHVVIGSQILAPLGHLRDIADSVLHHHERWDGGGYPGGIRGEEFAIERLRDLMDTAIEPRIYLALEAVVGRRRTLVFLEDDGRT